MKAFSLFLFLIAAFAGASFVYPALAAEVNFDIDTGAPYATGNTADFTLPIVIISIVSVIGFFVIILERKKANGIWFSNSEEYR